LHVPFFPPPKQTVLMDSPPFRLPFFRIQPLEFPEKRGSPATSPPPPFPSRVFPTSCLSPSPCLFTQVALPKRFKKSVGRVSPPTLFAFQIYFPSPPLCIESPSLVLHQNPEIFPPNFLRHSCLRCSMSPTFLPLFCPVGTSRAWSKGTPLPA